MYVLIQMTGQGGAPLPMLYYNLYSKVVLHQRGGVQARTRLLSWHREVLGGALQVQTGPG